MKIIERIRVMLKPPRKMTLAEFVADTEGGKVRKLGRAVSRSPRSHRGDWGEVMKPSGYAPAYVALYPQLSEIARKHGYALAVHGSMNRDFDLVCVPWAENVSAPDSVVQEIVRSFALTQVGEGTEKRHGRICYTLSVGFGECFLDFSFMAAVKAVAQ